LLLKAPSAAHHTGPHASAHSGLAAESVARAVGQTKVQLIECDWSLCQPGCNLVSLCLGDETLLYRERDTLFHISSAGSGLPLGWLGGTVLGERDCRGPDGEHEHRRDDSQDNFHFVGHLFPPPIFVFRLFGY
jgi:hypothetical protein